MSTNNNELNILQMNMMDITDDEIRRRLINDYNIECGPVTPQTKRILLKKLIKLEQERQQNIVASNAQIDNLVNNDPEYLHQSISITNGSSHNEEMSNGSDDDISEIQPFDTHEIIVPNIVQRQSPRRTTNKSSTPKNQLEIEKEAIETFKEVEKTLQMPESVKKSMLSQESNINLNEYSSNESEDDDETSVKMPTTKNLTTTSNTPNTYKISGITKARVSSNDNSGGSQAPLSAYRPTSLSRAPIRRSTTRPMFESRKTSLLNYSDGESDNEQPYTPFNKKDEIRQILLSHRPGLATRSRNIHSKPSSFFSKVNSFFKTIFGKLSRSSSPSSLASHRQEAANFSSFSNYVSWALLLLVAFFFVIIFSIYFYTKFTYTSKYNTLDLNAYAFIEDKTKLVAPICSAEISPENCLQFESDRKPALNIIKEIKSYIDKQIHKSYCEANGSPSEITSFVFRKGDFLKEIKANLRPDTTERGVSFANNAEQLMTYDIENAFKLIKWNQAWNIKVDHYQSELSLMPNYNINLPIRCCLKLFWKTNFWSIVFTSLSLLLGAIGIVYYSYSKHQKEEERRQVNDLISKSLELLQSPDEPQSMPVLHIRDTLLSPGEKNAKTKRIWNKVVDHIENNESRVKVEFKKIDGEEFKAWKWIAITCPAYMTDSENEADSLVPNSSQTQKIGGVEWQGQAFAFSNSKINVSSTSLNLTKNELDESYQPEMSRNKDFQALTRFLKIRNIFEKEAQYVDPNWSTKIKNTILEKTAKTSSDGKHDIVHIEFDDSTNEGLVFLKCLSMAGATNAFRALHGWWCEKKLVSVKFLKEERYYQRFPHAKNMNSPLKVTSID